MVKVTPGNLPGTRTTGYNFYKREGLDGSTEVIRRTVPTSKTQTGAGTLYLQLQREAFGNAAKLHASYNNLQKDFFRRSFVIATKTLKDGNTIPQMLTGRRLAIWDILDSWQHLHKPYPAPLGFCICAVDEYNNPVTGVTLKVTPQTFWEFTYEEQNSELACFPASALSPKHEPYYLTCGNGEYGPWTAKQIHDTHYLCIWNFTGIKHWNSMGTAIYCGTEWLERYKFNFAALGWEGEEHKVLIRGEVTQNQVTVGFLLGYWSGMFPVAVCSKTFYQGGVGTFEFGCNVRNGWVLVQRTTGDCWGGNYTVTKNIDLFGLD